MNDNHYFAQTNTHRRSTVLMHGPHRSGTLNLRKLPHA